ncbi:FAD-binding protein [Dehalobacter sp. DCM]|uniref:NAD(P)/FAD-dependent oxidoreductase n=1 Tax=Dehalobacter sp. DCM TaxID=2907827 RepID=UPI0030813DF6|nr:FAD-binding protein [Dehalobacter sp. DCM]
MNLVWTDIKLPVDQDVAELPDILARRLKLRREYIKNWQIVRRSVDARKKPEIFFVYTVAFSIPSPGSEFRRVLARYPQLRERSVDEVRIINSIPEKRLSSRPVIVGSGPAGYFAALTLAEKGYRPLVLERGDDVETRSSIVSGFWQGQKLDPESNVQFGEGGAGTFSDGKLTTRIDDARVRKVLETFCAFGADQEICYAAKPHIGTDVLKHVVAAIRKKIQDLGGEVCFRTRVSGLIIRNGRLEGLEIDAKDSLFAEAVILAVGNSARDVYEFLQQSGISLESKPLAIGLRIEHPQELINLSQYGVIRHPRLGAADYQLTYKDAATGRGAYTFCMCPGGQVIASSSEEGGIVINGMSNSRRDSGIANSAVVVTVSPMDYGSRDPLAGITFQREWERKAFQAGGNNYYVPAQTVQDFLNHKLSGEFALKPSYQPGYVPNDLHAVLPKEISGVLERALMAFDQKIKGFAGTEATLTGIESRTSAPVRILRDESGQSVNVQGLFPAGEGAGYAGGITSSAVDGIKAAEKLMAHYAMKE